MPYCFNCGSNINDSDKFCRECGAGLANTNIFNNENRKQVYEGTVHKCPHCGDTVPSFHSKCPSCGNEFRDITLSSTLKEFSDKLIEIDNQSKPDKKMRNIDYEELQLNKKISLITSFPIPNTKEDLLDFFILASSNINTNFGTSSFEDRLSEAWRSKYEQAYQKAKILIRDKDELMAIEEVYLAKNTKIKEKKRNTIKALIIYFLVLIFFGAISFIITISLANKQ